jgi:hypothetical protein
MRTESVYPNNMKTERNPIMDTRKALELAMTARAALGLAISELEILMSTTESSSDFEDYLQAKLKLEELLETM